MKNQGKKQVDALKALEPKTIESGSDNKPIITKEVYDKILEEKMNEITEMSDKIDFNNLTYKVIPIQ